MARPERVLDPAAGPVAEFATALRDLRRAAGNPGYRTLAAATGYSASTLSDAASGRRLPGLAVLRSFVAACGGDVEEWDRQWRRTSAALAAQVASARGGRADAPPYLGLACFQVSDADRYHGREALTATLADRVRRDGFLAVVGDSGSGKSSLVRAGLIPALLPEDPHAALVATPGERPLDEHGAGLAEPRPPVVAVDQFEEVFTHCHDADQRRAFLDALVAAAADPGCRVVVAVRPDFYGHCARHAGLAELLARATVPLGPMSEEELTKAITAPARRAGLTVERALVTKLLAEAKGQAGALPLLSHALLETWRHRSTTQLTLAGYESTGGVDGAVARTAEHEYAALGPAEQAAARWLLLRLTALGEGTADARRRVHVSELDRPGTDEVVDRFCRARLLVVGEDTVEVAHEALIGHWPRLTAWLSEDREALRVHRHLTDAARMWDTLGREPGDLYRGTRLTVAEECLAWGANREALNHVERDFLDAAVRARDDEEATARRRARQVRRLTAGLAVLLVLTVAGAATAVWQWREAVTERQQALSRQLSAQSGALADSDVAEAVRLAVAAHRATPTVESRGALLSLASHRAYSARLRHGDTIKDVALTRDGGRLAVAGQDGVLGWWDTASGAQLHRVAGFTDRVRAALRSVDIHPDDRRVAVGGADGTVWVWDAGTPAAAPRRWATGEGTVNAVAFSRDGRRLASVHSDGSVTVRAVGDRRVRRRFRVAPGARSDLAFDASGRHLAVVGGDGALGVWQLDSGRRLWGGQVPDDPQQMVRFHPVDRVLASAGKTGTVYVWSAATGRVVRELRGHVGEVRSASFDPHGYRLVSADSTGHLYVWDTATGALSTELVGNDTISYGVAVSADGGVVATGGRSAAALLWRFAERPFEGLRGEVADLSLSPDGRTLAATDPPTIIGARTTHETVMWDTATRALRSRDRTDASRPPARTSPRALTRLPTQPVLTLYSREAHLWDAESGRRVQTLRGFPDRQLAADLHAGRWLAAFGGGDRVVRLFDVRTGRILAAIPQPGRVHRLRITGDGGRLVTVLQSGHITVWDIAGRRALPTVAWGHTVVDAAIREDGAVVALAEGSGRVVVLDLRTGVPLSLPGHAGAAEALAISPDGRTLASGGQDAVVRLWDLRSGRLTAELRGHRDVVTSAVWSPDGGVLYTGGGESIAIAWTVDPSHALRQLCAGASGTLRRACG